MRTLHFAPGQQLALNEIGKSTELSPAMVTHLIGGLSRAGLVRQHGSPHDRRVKIAELTAEGEAAFQHVLPVIAQRMSSACDGFTDEEKATLLKLLQRLLEG
jgi:DNA-binding MarR family transcriptional regulator